MRARRRRKQSRSLASRFFRDLRTAWAKDGPECIRRAARHDPLAFVAMVARLMPARAADTMFPGEGMTDERLAELIAWAKQMMIDRRANRV